MSEKEKKTAEALAKVLEVLPDGKKEYLIGYAEGVTAMAEKVSAQEGPPVKPPTDRPV